MSEKSRSGADPLAFVQRGRIDWALACLAIAVALGLSASFAQGFPPSLLVAAWIGAGAFALAGTGALLWSDTVRFDAEGFSYVRARGVGPIRRRRRGYVSDLRRIELQPRTSRTFDGGSGVSYFATVKGERGSIPLSRYADGAAAREEMERLAARLGLAFAEAPGAVPGAISVPMRALLLAGVACSVLGLAAVAMWPVVSGHYFRERARRAAELGRIPERFGQFPSADPRLREGNRRLFDGDFLGAERLFREILEDRPKDELVHNQLAYALKGRGQAQAALEMAKKAVALAPRDGYIVDTLAEMNALCGNQEEAARQFERALGLSLPQDSTETHAKFGKTLLALGRFQNAYDELLKALAYDVGSEWNELARRLLRETKWPDTIKRRTPPTRDELRRRVPRFSPMPAPLGGTIPQPSAT